MFIGLVFDDVLLSVVLCSIVFGVESLVLGIKGVCVVLRRLGKYVSWVLVWSFVKYVACLLVVGVVVAVVG